MWSRVEDKITALPEKRLRKKRAHSTKPGGFVFQPRMLNKVEDCLLFLFPILEIVVLTATIVRDETSEAFQKYCLLSQIVFHLTFIS